MLIIVPGREDRSTKSRLHPLHSLNTSKHLGCLRRMIRIYLAADQLGGFICELLSFDLPSPLASMRRADKMSSLVP